MKKVLFLLALIVAACVISAHAESNLDNLKSKFQTIFESKSLDAVREVACGFGKYNFKSLKGKQFKGVDQTNPQYTFSLDFCQATDEAECKADGGSICQYDSSRSNAFVGALASFTSEEKPPVYKYVVEDDPAAGVDVIFTNGSKCYSSGWVDRHVTLRLTCGDSPASFTVSENPSCTYFIDFPTKALCKGGSGGKGGLSGGAIFLIVILVVSVIYVITGCAICITKYGKPFGLQACPHRGFWFALPGLFIDGIKYTFGKIAGCCGSKTITTSSGEYEAA